MKKLSAFAVFQKSRRVAKPKKRKYSENTAESADADHNDDIDAELTTVDREPHVNCQDANRTSNNKKRKDYVPPPSGYQNGMHRDEDKQPQFAGDRPPLPENDPVVEVSHPTSTCYMFDSRLEGQKCLEWLIHPFQCKQFFSEVWEQKPLLLKRQNSGYYRQLFSTSYLDSLLREKYVLFGTNLDVTTYVDGCRETHNPPGRAHAPVVWDFYKNGCSVRLKNPQYFSKLVWKLNSTLQEAFGSFVGANVYLTPPASQGFAPHYDDIEAFVLQLEGKKRWKLYNPRTPDEVLPRFPSDNFKEEEIGKPILEVELSAGDLLYFPRGTIHQAKTLPDCHSLHVTVSVSQRNTWGDLLLKLVPRALDIAIESNVEFRRSLPCDYTRYMGIANSDLDLPERRSFEEKVRRLMQELLSEAPLDAAVDQMAKDFVHDSLPLFLTKDEKPRSVHCCRRQLSDKGCVGESGVALRSGTRLKLLRANLVRLVLEDDGVKVYHSADNSRDYRAEDIQFVEIDPKLAPAVEFFIHSYPDYVAIEDVPLESLDEKLRISTLLFNAGLLMTEDIIADKQP